PKQHQLPKQHPKQHQHPTQLPTQLPKQPPKQDFILRVSLVDYHGNAILDEIIRQPF
ncbi:7383_t:CDS:2, partial [Racocetra fulgida]